MTPRPPHPAPREIEVRLLGPDDLPLLLRADEDVFDHAVDPASAGQFLADPRHHLAVALDDGVIVGMVSAVHYVHPDKPTELWINEVGVAGSHRQRGIGRMLVRAMLQHGRQLGAHQAWVLTERTNDAAMALYAAAGGLESPDEIVMFEFELDPPPDPPR